MRKVEEQGSGLILGRPPRKNVLYKGGLQPPPGDPGPKAVLERTGSPIPCDEGEDLLKGGLARGISESREAPEGPVSSTAGFGAGGRGPLAPAGGGWRSSPAGSGWRTRPPSTPWRCWGGSRRPCSLGSNLRNRDAKRMAHARFSLFYKLPPEPLGCPIAPPEGKGIAWCGTVPPQKWMNFSTKVLSRCASTPGLKLQVSFEEPPGERATEAKREETKAALRDLRGWMTSAHGRSSWRSGTWRSPPCSARPPDRLDRGCTAKPQGPGGVARTGPGCRRGRRGNRDRSSIEFSGTARADPLAGVWRSGT